MCLRSKPKRDIKYTLLTINERMTRILSNLMSASAALPTSKNALDDAKRQRKYVHNVGCKYAPSYFATHRHSMTASVLDVL
jgi:hypothetical protein